MVGSSMVVDGVSARLALLFGYVESGIAAFLSSLVVLFA